MGLNWISWDLLGLNGGVMELEDLTPQETVVQ